MQKVKLGALETINHYFVSLYDNFTHKHLIFIRIYKSPTTFCWFHVVKMLQSPMIIA